MPTIVLCYNIPQPFAVILANFDFCCIKISMAYFSYNIFFPIPGVDLVVHAAGPFQQKESCSVLEAAINTKVARLLSKID